MLKEKLQIYKKRPQARSRLRAKLHEDLWVNILAIVGTVIFVILAVALSYGLTTLLLCWSYNSYIAPAFGWITVKFSTMFAIVVALSIVGGFFKNTANTSK